MRRYRGAERTLATILREKGETCADKWFVVTDERRTTYRELDEASNRLARGAADLGIRANETVLVMMPNTLDFISIWCALAKVGAIEVPVNTAYRGNILAHIINDSRATTLIVDRQFLERLEAIEPKLSGLQRLVVYSEDTGLAADNDGLPPALARRFEHRSFGELYASSAAPLETGPRYTDLIAVMYTSGTTGPSKGVMITHAHAYEYAWAVVELLDLGSDDVYYAPLPLFHIAGQWAVIYAACLADATAVLTRQFSISSFWGDVARHNVTATFLLGAMANFLYRQPPAELDSGNLLRKALVVPLFPEIEEFKRRFGVRVSTTYGSTEVNVPFRMGFDLVDARSCGRVATDQYEVRIVDSDDQEVPAGVVGELVVRPKEPWITMAGYWNRPDWTAEAWRNLWLHSGDALYRDEQGNFYFVDRLKDAIRRRGENISSFEVENEINAHPAVLESAVIPVRSEYTEDEVKAVVVLKEGARLTPEELIRFLEPRMPHFMVPRYVEFVEHLPKTTTGKIQKFPLREQGITPATWDREKAGVRLKE